MYAALLLSVIIANQADTKVPVRAPLPEKIVTLPVVTDAVSAAAADIMVVPEPHRRFQRYVWIPPWATADWVGATNLSIQLALNHDATLSRPVLLSVPGQDDWSGWILRYDLRTLTSDLEFMASFWDSLAHQDPYVHIVDFEGAIGNEDTLPILAPHIDGEAAALLSRETNCQGPLFRADWLCVVLLTTVDGGRYYGARRIFELIKSVPATEKTRTDLDKYLLAMGVDVRLNQQLRADKRAIVLRSGVTGKKRRVDQYRGVYGATHITQDIADGNTRIASQVDRNLIRFVPDAKEIIVTRRDGLPDFILANASGKIQLSVPDNIALDHTIPGPSDGRGTPGTKRLIPGISCIRCHSPSDIMLDVSHDIADVLSTHGTLDVVDDAASLNLDANFPAIERIAGLYADTLGFDRFMQIARDDYSRAIRRCANLLTEGDGLVTVAEAGSSIGAIYSSIEWDLVTPHRACMEIGYLLPSGHDPAEFLRLQLSPRDAGDEDIAVATLQAGKSVLRRDWERVYADVASRLKVLEPTDQPPVEE